MMARRPISLKAICIALCETQVAIGTQTRTRSGKWTAQASACIPPIEPPMTANNCEMPKCSISFACTATMSRTVTGGKSMP